MKILERLRNRSPHRETGAPGSAEASPAAEPRLPIPRYDQLDGKQVCQQLSQLSQVELAAVEAHERSHRARPVVLNRLRWLRGTNRCPATTRLTQTRSSERWPTPTQQPSKPCAPTNATTEIAATCEQKSHASSPRHRQVPHKIGRANRRPRSSKQAFGPIRPRHELTSTARRRRPRANTAASTASTQRGTQRNERERLRNEARYSRERLELYRARLYSGRAASQGKLRELERASDGAAARLRRAEAAAPPTDPPT